MFPHDTFGVWQGVAVTKDGLPSEPQHGRNQEIMVDSLISQSHHAELGRELEPWVPDEDDPQCPELDNIFDGHWNRLFILMNCKIVSFLETLAATCMPVNCLYFRVQKIEKLYYVCFIF